MRYKQTNNEKKTPQNNRMQLKNLIIRNFLKYSKEYYIVPNSSPSPYLYGYMKLKNQLNQLHYIKLTK